MFVRPGLPLTLVFTPKRDRLSSRVVSRPFPMTPDLLLESGGMPETLRSASSGLNLDSSSRVEVWPYCCVRRNRSSSHSKYRVSMLSHQDTQ
jgi:hypothetical protein